MRVRSRLAVLAILGAGLGAMTPSALAAPCTWTWDGGAGTTAWGTDTNWDTNMLPGPADIVCLGAAEVVHGAGSTAVLAIQGGSGQLRVTGGTLWLTSTTEPSPFPGVISAEGGELRLAGPVTTDAVELAGGTLRVDGTAVLTVRSLRLQSGTITGSGVLHVAGPDPTLSALVKSTAGLATIDVGTLDAPRVDVQAGTLVVASPVWTQVAAGSLSGQLTLSGPVTLQTAQPITTIAAAGVLYVTGDPIFATGSGAYELPARIAGAVNLYAGTPAVSALEVLAGGRLTLEGTELSAASATVRTNGVLSGAETADSGLTVATPLLVEWLGQLRGSLRVIGDVQLDGVIEPGSVFTPSIEVSGAVLVLGDGRAQDRDPRVRPVQRRRPRHGGRVRARRRA